MSSEFTKHFGKHTNFFLCIYGVEFQTANGNVARKTSITPFKCLPKTTGFLGFVPLGFLLPSKLSLRDFIVEAPADCDEYPGCLPLSHTCWVRKSGVQKTQLRFVCFVEISLFYTQMVFSPDFWSINSTTNPTETSVRGPVPSLGIPSSKLLSFSAARRCASKCCKEWELDHSREARQLNWTAIE